MADDLVNSFKTGPDEQGRFGIYGGRFVSETLMPLILSLEAEYERAKTDADFWARKRCADYPKQPNERGKGAPTAKHGRGKYAQIKRRLTNGFRV